MNAAAFSLLPWDSAFFGFPTARILSPHLDGPDLRDVLGAFKDSGIALAYWSVDPADVGSNAAAVACNGFLVDVKTTYAIASPAADASRMRWPAVPVREPIAPEALAALIALGVTAGKHSRYNVDPGFPPHLCKALYEEWMRKCLSGEKADAVLAVEDGGVPVGIVTVQVKDGVGEIGLVAVDAAHEGQGIGTSLMQAALGWFADRKCAKAEVVTQEANREACRLYERNGFRVAGRVNVYHFRPLG
jgi:ribosomal protein S18 acetylase RimI-like enzyme